MVGRAQAAIECVNLMIFVFICFTMK